MPLFLLSCMSAGRLQVVRGNLGECSAATAGKQRFNQQVSEAIKPDRDFTYCKTDSTEGKLKACQSYLLQ